MMLLTRLASSSIFAGCLVNALSIPPKSNVTVILDSGSFKGIASGVTNQFLGIPYAKPPVGDLRLRLPVEYPPYNGTFEAGAFGHMCPNQFPEVLSASTLGRAADKLLEKIWVRLYPSSEDCLTVNVITPQIPDPVSSLPVVVWIYGGAFTMGTTQEYHGETVVGRSFEIGRPIIFVSFNYRIGVLGFLGGQQVKDAGVGNLGLHDQRLALRWVKKYIAQFGGDPDRVTLWGESAGAMSVGLQMVINGGNTDGLFHAAFMQSGAPLPIGDIKNGQAVYDSFATKLGCAKEKDSLSCIRKAPFNDVYNAANNVPGIFLPRVDGVILTETPFESVKNGRIARIPYVTGDVDDEGTIFAVPYLGVATDDQVKAYLKSRFLPSATPEELRKVMTLYGPNQKLGSPYGTGDAHEYSHQFKRIASIEGDMVFHAPRRYLLSQTWDKQRAWNYHSTIGKTGHFGSYHTSDLAYTFGDGSLQEYLIRFVVNMDPNGRPPNPSLISWPQYTEPATATLLMQDTGPLLSITNDTFRAPQIHYLRDLEIKYPV